MKTRISSLALAALLAASTSLVSAPAAAAGHGFGGAGRGFSGGHGFAGSGWHGGRGGFNRGGFGHRGYWPGVFWGGIGLGLGIGAIGYYNGYYAPYPYYDGAYYDEPAVIVSPGYPAADPAAGSRSGQPVPQASSRGAEPIFYPRNGQTAATTESDRRECNRWATSQAGAMTDASIFQRATLACMEGRGYTAR
jgi:hypothetical protein